MRQRGRKSAAALAIAEPITAVSRVAPPGDLTTGQRQVWLVTVNSRPADWFGPEQIPLLEAYCRHVAYARQIAAELDLVQAEWLADDDGLKRHKTLLEIHEKQTRALSSLATRLRLTNQATQEAKTAGRAKRAFAAVKPWQTIDEAEPEEHPVD